MTTQKQKTGILSSSGTELEEAFFTLISFAVVMFVLYLAINLYNIFY
jgi:hypothetical protein